LQRSNSWLDVILILDPVPYVYGLHSTSTMSPTVAAVPGLVAAVSGWPDTDSPWAMKDDREWTTHVAGGVSAAAAMRVVDVERAGCACAAPDAVADAAPAARARATAILKAKVRRGGPITAITTSQV
jgi:hypothetical protein